MPRIMVYLGAFLVAGTFSSVSALVLEELHLADGRTEDNRMYSPVYDTADVGAVSFGEIRYASGGDRFVVYRMTETLLTPSPKYKTPRYKLAPSIDMGALVGEALRSEAADMGFSEGTDGGGWKVSGEVHDLVVEIRQSGGGFGPLLFYGYMEIELQVEDASGNSSSERMKTYNMSHHYNAGFGTQDEAREAMALFLIESAQDVVARLNRKIFKAPPHSRVADTLRRLQPNGDDMENPLRVVGLSGSLEAVPKLLEMLEQEQDEGDRVEIINALAVIGSEDAFEALSRRYRGEDKDCRVFTLKAMDYLGTDEARAFIEKNGRHDGHLPCRVIARRAG